MGGWCIIVICADRPMIEWVTELANAASIVVAILVWRTKIRLIWLVAAGALFGGLGWI